MEILNVEISEDMKNHKELITKINEIIEKFERS